MDAGLIVLIVIIVIAAVISSFFRTPKGKGIIGEAKVKRAIGKTKSGEKYVYNNFMIVDDGKSSQIDHIVVNKSGVFVIETKNYSGIISGHQDQQEWTQTLSYGKVKNKFYSPVKQNATHIYRLKNQTGLDVPFYSVVVFVQDNAKYVDSKELFSPKGLKKLIKTGPVLLSSEEIDKVAEMIEKSENTSVSMKEHIQEIHSMQADIENGICPRCDSKLVIRNGKNGQFYGCSNYPDCKFTKNI